MQVYAGPKSKQKGFFVEEDLDTQVKEDRVDHVLMSDSSENDEASGVQRRENNEVISL